jgi:galactokinase
VALVRADLAAMFASNVAASYEDAVEIKPNVYVCQATDGADIVG